MYMYNVYTFAYVQCTYDRYTVYQEVVVVEASNDGEASRLLLLSDQVE